jgi:hypothetical protein
MTGTNTGTIDLFGLPPTGRPVTMTGRCRRLDWAHCGRLNWPHLRPS